MLDAFRRAMRRRNLADGSIYVRLREVRFWLEYLEARGIELVDADRHVFERWLDERPLGARAKYAAISHLHMFYRWAQREGLVDRDPTELVERPRLPATLPRPMPEADVELALATAPTTALRTAIALMAWGALRCCEVSWLEWSDVDLAAGTMLVTGKGRKQRIVPLGKLLRAELVALDSTSGPVLGRRWQPGYTSQQVNAHLRSCGIERHTAHAFRHRKLTRLCEETQDIVAVQNFAGHASPATTQIYVLVAAARVMALAELSD